ncbi:spore cortex biosynthesis protein YabQ [Cohnella herbarum]|uniref:Spore cortex biosynthesis protein YabQ n=1 Tax=Cohnella herbarum TaxID=2728023 RepID=A0A7Z2ZN62_9BACL|nr:spore cortex biosynthesis protein YabQ [Cohnella herbarum]QJD85868.1 spore cortex biosynthesis protein YabQ [Cohnella herbarum]
MSAAAQGMTIAFMMMCGLVMGLVFDVYRVASHRFHVARWLLPGLDVVYWAAATLGVFSILLSHNEGEVRMYVFLGLGIGVTGYFGLFSNWVVKLSGKLFDMIKSIFLFAWKLVDTILLTPFLWIVRLLAKILDIVFIVTVATLLWIGKLLLKPVARIGGWVWHKLLPVRRKFEPVVKAYRSLSERAKRIRDAWRKK